MSTTTTANPTKVSPARIQTRTLRTHEALCNTMKHVLSFYVHHDDPISALRTDIQNSPAGALSLIRSGKFLDTEYDQVQFLHSVGVYKHPNIYTAYCALLMSAIGTLLHDNCN